MARMWGTSRTHRLRAAEEITQLSLVQRLTVLQQEASHHIRTGGNELVPDQMLDAARGLLIEEVQALAEKLKQGGQSRGKGREG